MLNEDQIRAVIIERLEACNGTCNPWHIYHLDGIMRGLLWALQGSDPGTYLTTDVAALLDRAGISFRRVHGAIGSPRIEIIKPASLDLS